MSHEEDLDDTARLVLMDTPGISFSKFVMAVRKTNAVDLMSAQTLFTKYRGWDGRRFPTHSIETGKRL